MITETRRQRLAPWLLLIMLGVGCGERDEVRPFGRQTIKIDAVPAEIMDSARKELPQVKFEEAWKNLDPKGELMSYEIRGKTSNGKVREARVSLTGEILETE
ncbi:MAG: hypothetical protein ABI353_22875 [Isosphaeraceae bacterium]